jgi:GT2 family glycosyltransferase
MKYSFVIPTYNKKKLLKRTLEALNHLEGFGENDYEAVVVDDGSSDDVFGYIKGVNTGYRLNYMYLDRCPQSCRSRSRNYGVAAARGEYIVFIDDDVVVNKDYLLQLDRYYRYSNDFVIIGTRINCPADMLETHEPAELRKMAFSDGEAGAGMLEERHLTFNSLSYNLSAHRYPWMMMATGNMAVPRRRLTDIGGFDETFNKWGFEDLELGYRLYKNGAPFVVNGQLLVFHQDHPVAPEGENNFQHFLEKCKDVFDEIEPTKLLSVHGLHNPSGKTLKLFRKYNGEISARHTVHFDREQDLEDVKREIMELCKEDGSEVTVRDGVQGTDLDVWLQGLRTEGNILHYIPASFAVSKRKASAALRCLLDQRAARAKNKTNRRRVHKHGNIK